MFDAHLLLPRSRAKMQRGENMQDAMACKTD